LDAYYSQIDEAQNPIRPNEVAALVDSPVRELPIPVPPDPRRGWLVAVAAAVAVLVLVGGAALLLRVIGSGTPVADPTSSLAWSRVLHDEEVFGGVGDQVMNSVTAGGPGLVAVGNDGSFLNPDAAVWTSVDGITWSRVPHDEAVFGGGNRGVNGRWMWSVTAGGPGVVAVGTAGDSLAVVWTSPDGITWSRVPHDAAVFGGESIQVMLSVTAGGPGLVAVGSTGSLRDEDAAVWTSPDGITWSRVPYDEAVFGGATMRSVTAGGPGLVAVGSAELGDDSRAAVWTSPDGITWSRVPHDEAVFGGAGGQWMSSVTAGGPGLVAVGGSGVGGDQGPTVTRDAVVWTSRDGITWSRVPDDEAVFGGESFRSMSSVTAGGPGLVAVGWDETVGDEDAAVWTSPDGITWSRVPHDEAVFGGENTQSMNSVTAGGSGLVAVGSAGSGNNLDGLDAAVWGD
jgi:hypothetical protein